MRSTSACWFLIIGKVDKSAGVSLNFIIFAYQDAFTAISTIFVSLASKDTQGIYIMLHARPVILDARDVSLLNNCNASPVIQDTGL